MVLTEWMNSKYGTAFDEADLASIKDFSLIWNVFESKVCGNHFSISRLQQNLADRNLDINIFQIHLNYFRNRYVFHGAITPRFIFLHFRAGDRRQLVEDVMLGNNNTTNDIILAIIIIVYRFRNNLFHGLKNIKHINQQRENFETANDFLIKFIDNF